MDDYPSVPYDSSPLRLKAVRPVPVPAQVNEEPSVELRGITKRFGHTLAVDGVDLFVRKGEFLSLLGPSGCGKTTTLRIVAGFVTPDIGAIFIDGREISTVPPHSRNIGMVYQSYALFPHKTVFDNVAFGLRMRKVDRIREEVKRVLELVQLVGVESRFPGQLSGGQQQRVALARALVIEPRVLLLDEPLSNLDAQLRKQMQIELRSLQERLRISTIYVTHDQEEALALSDRVVLMNDGRIQQVGTPMEVYERPANGFVAEFLGTGNLLAGRLEPHSLGLSLFRSSTGTVLEVRPVSDTAVYSGTCSVSIRPEQVELGKARQTGTNWLQARVVYASYRGSRYLYLVALESGDNLTVEVGNKGLGQMYRRGDVLTCHIPMDAVHILSGRETTTTIAED